MAETKTVEVDGKEVEVTVDNQGDAWANVVELTDFGRAIKPHCNKIRQDDRVRNDGVAHFSEDKTGKILEELATHDVDLVAREPSGRSKADHFITWSEPEK